MELRSMFQKVFGGVRSPTTKSFELLNSSNTTFYSWNGNIYQSDIVRSAIRPKVNAIGKLSPKHIRGDGANMKINPEPWLIEVLRNPNPYMTMQDLLMKLTWRREIEHNAFAYILRDGMGYVKEIHPIVASNAELVEAEGLVFIKLHFNSGKFVVLPYADVIHLRKDFNEHEFFGDSGIKPIEPVMSVITMSDQSIVNAVKNSAVIKWLLKFKSVMRPEDKQVEVDIFKKNFLTYSNDGGTVTSDHKYDVEQVKQEQFVPNALQMKEPTQRLFSYFGVNDAIVQNKYTEDQFNAFYESELEPIALQLSNEFTRKLFTTKERSFGNKIIFEASSLQYASMTTKLGLVQLVDRGALTPNEWRLVLNLGPIENGDKPIRRLDTEEVNKSDSKVDEKADATDEKTVIEGVDTLQDVTLDSGTIAQVSLNGAQIQSLIQIVQSVKDGVLEYESAIELIVGAFPFDEDKAKKILGSKLEKTVGDDDGAGSSSGEDEKSG